MSIYIDTQGGSAHFSRGGDRMRMRHVVIIGAGVGGLSAALRLADGPDEVHRNSIAKLELARHIATMPQEVDMPVTRGS
jgi:choline dehydrogenase-like flavoprotein